jgi:peroxiredoxin Q/BCP
VSERLQVGDPAPEFSLPGTGHRTYTLEQYRGLPVVLVFYPGDNTPVCTEQLTSYSSDIARFDGLGAQVLAISPQDVESHEQFAAEFGFAFPLLADVDQEVGRAYGVVGPLGFYRRSVFVVDAGGTIRYIHRARAGLTFRPADELVAAVEAARRPSTRPAV